MREGTQEMLQVEGALIQWDIWEGLHEEETFSFISPGHTWYFYISYLISPLIYIINITRFYRIWIWKVQIIFLFWGPMSNRKLRENKVLQNSSFRKHFSHFSHKGEMCVTAQGYVPLSLCSLTSHYYWLLWSGAENYVERDCPSFKDIVITNCCEIRLWDTVSIV